MLKKVCKKCLYVFEGTGDTCPECLESKKKYQDYIGSMFYVYEFIRLDTNEPFYVGKGKDGRAFRKLPNQRQIRLSNLVKEIRQNNSDYAVNIVERNILDEEIALQKEKELIEEYAFDFGYDLVNLQHSGDVEYREKISKSTKEAMQDEVVKLKCSDSAKKAWEDEEYRAKITAALKRPRKSAPKTKPKVQVVNIVTNEIVVDVEGMSNAKIAMAALGFGSKKFAKLRNGEVFEDLKLIKIDQK